jgi:hypothetical protein
VPLAAPSAFGEALHLVRRDLVGVRMVLALVIAGLPTMMGTINTGILAFRISAVTARRLSSSLTSSATSQFGHFKLLRHRRELHLL